MCSQDLSNSEKLVGFIILTCLPWTSHSLPCNVSLAESCPASLYYVPRTMRTLDETAALFGVNSNAVNRTVDGFLVAITCSCLALHAEFTWHLDYEVQPQDTWDSISSKFGSFVVEKREKTLIPSQTVTLDILCSCSRNASTVTYKRAYQTIPCLTIKVCEKINLFLHFLMIIDKFVYVSVDAAEYSSGQKSSKFQILAIIGAILAASAIFLFTVILVLWKRYNKKRNQTPKPYSRMMDSMHSSFDSRTFLKKSGGKIVCSFSYDKAIEFPYNEVRDATSNFSSSLKIGQGSCGSVYLGKIRGNDVAVKQMKNTKTKEFVSEINILCKVHHSNLIELIGYAAGGDSLFLVYEFAQNGALSDHLHGFTRRGYNPLGWTMRVRIAMDAAKGLEYIHKYTKPYYVHRDVKTSNILLDSSFRAKIITSEQIADFGLVKLLDLDHSPDVGAAASRIVGTFGYLSPEYGSGSIRYVRDGCVTTKTDVYAFGVVLLELLTGQPALSRDASPGNNRSIEHRTVADFVLPALNDNENLMIKLAKCVDPNLTHYHKETVLQDCVDDNWKHRPDMSEVVFCLSHILASTEEWENQRCSRTEP
ncbi:Nucleotide-sugar transporter family protein [Hibiscus syriacus]|uniref:Nucleotide-sugar transporter family protein n=1 Tax=Hibiscus syriacus TaxID=106335 RepID=A0A6A2WG76_HIBSY|nr:Nucleotide-sugar transporter family protein [Hibiscus syriacus]